MKPSKLFGLIAGLIFTASPAIAQLNLYKAEFNAAGDLEGWTDSGSKLKEFLYDGVTFTGEEEVNGGAFRAKVAGDASADAQMFKGGLSISGDSAKELVVRMRQTPDNGATWDTAGNMSGILAVIAGTVFSGSPEVIQTADEIVTGDGWTRITIPLRGGGGDSIPAGSTINSIRFDPSTTLNESFEIDFIRLTAVDNPPAPLAELNPTSAIGGKFLLDQEWHWDVAGSLDGWSTANFNTTVSGSVVTGTSTTVDPNFNSPTFSTTVPTSGEMIIEIGVITDAAGTGAAPEFFWQDSNGGFASARRVGLPALPADGLPHVIRMTFTGDIAGTLSRIRYDPSNTASITSKIDYVRVYVDQGMPAAPAVNFTWDGGGFDTNFSTAANWVGNTAPTGLGTAFGFGALTGPQQTTANADLTGNSQRFVFFENAPAMTVTGNFIQMGTSGIETPIANYSANLQTFNNDVRQYWISGSANRTWDAVNVNGTLEFNQVTLRGDSSVANALTWTLTGAGDGRITSNVVDSISWTGKTVGLIKTGTGTWDLQGALSSRINSIAVNNGTLLLGGSNTASITVASGATLGASGSAGGTITAGAGATIGGTLALEIDGAAIDLLAVTGALNVSNATIDFQVTGAAPSASSYTLATASGGVTGTPAVTNLPAGYAVVVGANAITLVSSPDMNVNQDGLIANGGSKSFGNVAVGTTNALTFTINNTSPTATLTLDGSPRVAVSGTHAGDFTVTSQPSTPVAASGSTTFTVVFEPRASGTRNATLTIENNDLDDDPYVINISGSGTGIDHVWNGGGADGNFTTAANWAGSAPSSDPSAAGLNAKKFGFGALTGPQQATANANYSETNFGNPYLFVFFQDAAPMTITGNPFQVVDSGIVRVIINYSPNLQIFDNEVRQFWFGGSTNRTWDAADVDGTLEFNGPEATHSVWLRADALTGGTYTWTLTGAGNGRITKGVRMDSGASQWGGENLDLIKSGAGTWDLQGSLPVSLRNISVSEGTLILGGNNTYSGATTVSGGTLLVNGNNGSSTIGVASGATLGGGGTVGGAITVDADGTIAPGATIGTLTATAGATINGTLAVEIDGAGIDRLAVAGTLDVSNSTINFEVIGAAPAESSYTLATATVGITGTPGATNVPTGYEVNVGANAITLVALSPYDQWAATFPSADLSDPQGDFDNDGLKNIQEFAFDTDPTTATGPITLDEDGIVTNGKGTPIAHLNEITETSVDFRAIFSRRKDHVAAGLVYSVQFSTELDEWVDYEFAPGEPMLLDGTDPDIDVMYVLFPLAVQTSRGFEKPKFVRVGVAFEE